MTKKFYLVYLLFSVTIIFIIFNSHKDGVYYNTSNTFSGAPGDLYGTCNYCHVDNANNSGPGTLQVNFNNGTHWYEPGKTYTVTISIQNQNSTRNGFQATSLTNAGNNRAGAFLPPSGTDTFQVNISGSNRNYIEHNTLSTSGSWTMQWQAPSTNMGEIKIYATGVVGAGYLNSTQGDFPYSTTLLLKPLVQPAANFSADKTTICQGDTITFTSTSTAAFTYNWSFSSGQPLSTTDSVVKVVANQPGSITTTLAVSNSLGNDQLSKNNYVTVNSAPIVSFTKNNVSCHGMADGCITATGSGSYAYNWDTGSSGQQICNLSPGKYCITVTDPASGCAIDTCFTISEPAQMTSSISAMDVSCHGAFDGNVSVTVNGGNPPYTLIWSNGTDTVNPNNLPGGTYYVTVTDNMGCELTDNILVSEPSPIVLDTTITHTTTGSDGSITLSVTGGEPPYDYKWSNGSWQKNLNFLNGGEYCVTVTDDAGCTASLCAFVNFPAGAGSSVLENVQITVHPNPATDKIQIKTNRSTLLNHVEILDTKGTVVLTAAYPGNTTAELDIRHLKPGVYFLLTEVKGSQSIHQFFVVR